MFKNLDPKSLIIGALLMMVLVAIMLLATPNNTPTQWEYKNLALLGQGGHEATLNGLGKDGWEVVGFAYTPGGPQANHYG